MGVDVRFQGCVFQHYSPLGPDEVMEENKNT